MAESTGVRNCHKLPGASGELGCYQYKESTYRLYAREVLGYVPRRSYINERYVAVRMIQKWLNQGYSTYEIGLIWNGGEPREKKGINSHGIEYDSARYARTVVAYYKQQ